MSLISYFRIYKIDNSLCTFNLKNNEILNYINTFISNELKETDLSKLAFKKVNTKIEYFSFSWVITENKKDNWINLPEWFNFLLLFWEKEKYKDIEKKYIRVKSSILSVFRVSWNLYIVTFWNWFHSIPREILESDFWIELWKKMITRDWKIKSIYQSVIKWDLENTFKSLKRNNKYDPMLDPTNLWKITKWLNWFADTKLLFHDIPSLQFLNIWLEWNEWIKFHVWKIDKDILLKIIKKIDDTSKIKVTNALKIPDLKKINNNDKLYLEIIDEISKVKDFYFSAYLLNKYIFWDNSVSWRIISFDIIESWKRFSYSEQKFWVLENFDLIYELNKHNYALTNLTQVRFTKIIIENDTQWEKRESLWVSPNLLNCISGEIEVNKELYLYEWTNIYLPNKDFKDIVVTNFDSKIDKYTIKDEKLNKFLLDWDLVKETKESEYNKKHDKNLDIVNWIVDNYCFDKWVSKVYWYWKWNEIEICDLLKKNKSKHYFIHVKKTGWANIRELFSQWRVSTSLIIDEVDWIRKHIFKHAKIKINRNIFLNREFVIVFAIKKCTKTVFTLYAKYDFISTLEYFHDKWMDNNIYIYYIG